MKKVLFLCIATSLFACTNSAHKNDSVDSANESNQSKDSAKAGVSDMDTTASDENFLTKAYSGGMLEVMLGNIAQQNAASQVVKEFGRMMITDHTKADSDMVALAKVKGITLPSAPSNDAYDKIDKLKGKRGNDFDVDYVNLMIDDHKEDIADYQREVQNGKDSDIIASAKKTIPVLEKHLSTIQVIKNSVRP